MEEIDFEGIKELINSGEYHPGQILKSLDEIKMCMEDQRFENISPNDYRYKVDILVPYLSEEAFVQYKSRVEAALANVKAKRGMISQEIADEIAQACSQVRAKEVYEEEERTQHDIIAQTNKIKDKVSDAAKSAVHVPATSFDIVETANAARYIGAFKHVIIPDMVALERIWIEACREYSGLLQIGRTHLQHAEPITYGFANAWFAGRFGGRILKIRQAIDELNGKFSGALGAYNAPSLFFDDPEVFEKEVLSELGVNPAEISTQICPPEPIGDLVNYVISSFSVLANWADDMRELQRPEIGEVGQPRGEDISASSTMPHKKNPVGLENIKSLWKVAASRMMTMYLDQISADQRDLTNSASQRYTPEIFNLFDYAVRRAARIAKKIKPHEHNMKRNFLMSADKVIAEPLQIILSSYGHPGAHPYVQALVERSYTENVPLTKLALNDPSLKPYIDRFTTKQMEIISDPSKYTGLASKIALKTADIWESRLRYQGLL